MRLLTTVLLVTLAACGMPGEETDLLDRAYVVSEESNELFVFDSSTLEAVGSVDTTVFDGRANANHMAIVSPDGAEVWVSASHVNSMVVVDGRTLEVTDIIEVGAHNSHASFNESGTELWTVVEDDNTVVVIDTETHEITHTIADETLAIPHNVRFSTDGALAYVPNIGGNQITIIDTATYTAVDALVAEGVEEGACDTDPCGFADAQIDEEGMLYAAHITSGQVLVYDTLAQETLEQIEVGPRPWAAFVDVGDVSPASWMVPNFGDATVSVIDRVTLAESKVEHGDDESYGVNYSALAPDEAFVLNKHAERIAVLDATTGELIEHIDVGGTAETATTTPDGRYLLLPLSSTGELAVLDVTTHEVVKRFADVGTYPWSVAMAGGQNYCH